MVPVGTIAAVISVILWIIASTIAKKISRDLGGEIAAFFYSMIGLLPIFIATIVVGVFAVSLPSVALALFAGLFLGIGFITGFKALHTEHLSSTSAFAEIQPALLVMLGLLVLGESVTLIQIVSMAVILIGVLMVLTNEKMRINIRLLPALICAICWGIYWVVITYAVLAAGTFALPILISRLVGVPFVLWYVLRDRRSVGTLRNFWKVIKSNRTFAVLISLAIVACFSDAIGDVLFGITVGSTVLVIGAALVALQPMMTSFFGFVLYKERLTRVQLYGILIMVMGAAVLTIL